MSQVIYIIDDDTVLRTAYAAELHKLGYEVETGSDGNEAKQMIAKSKPALILLDMLMPNLDGIGFLKEFRQDPSNDDVKVVVASNFESMPEATELNVSKYLSKLSHTPDAVAAAVDEVMKEGTAA
jgi:CheY-like chemotaxis protein